MNRKLTGLLGLSRRAGRMTTGYDAVAALVAAGEDVLILLAADLSEKTEKELRFVIGEKPVTLLRLPLDKAEIAGALGLQKPVGVCAVSDKGFAAAIEKQCRHDLEEEE